MSNAGEWGFNPLEDPSQDPGEIAKQAAFEIAVATGIGHHDIALTLGSGWGEVVDMIGKTTEEIPAEEITGFSTSGPPGVVMAMAVMLFIEQVLSGTSEHAVCVEPHGPAMTKWPPESEGVPP